MKASFFKIIMSAAAVLLAIGGSFATYTSERKAQQAVIGYANSIDGTPCAITVLCGNILWICTVTIGGVNVQAYSKFNPSDTTCPIVARARQQ